MIQTRLIFFDGDFSPNYRTYDYLRIVELEKENKKLKLSQRSYKGHATRRTKKTK